MGTLQGKVAIVTGSARGIGRATALAYAREGARVVINSRTDEEVKRTVREVTDAGGEAAGIPADVSQPQGVDRLVDETVARWGRVDILVNNAAVMGPLAPVGWDDRDEWRFTLEVNLFGCYLMLHRVVPIMVRQRKGKVINVSSPNALRQDSWLTAYGVAKAALVRLTSSVATFTAPYGVDVNVVDVIGYTDLAKDIGKQQDQDFLVAEYWRRRSQRGIVLDPATNVPMMLWLASPESDGLTGRFVRWSMNLDDLKAAKDRIVASPSALRLGLQVPEGIRESEEARWYLSESAKVLAEIEADLAHRPRYPGV
ncbi:MAG: SDR family oxidoreductase [Chloroflexi bacterium]|nr:SDR family oxidoreductase [Chloroflexota bacterium]